MSVVTATWETEVEGHGLRLAQVKARPYLKNNESRKSWGRASSGKVLA
jgi:hypothetical protein